MATKKEYFDFKKEYKEFYLPPKKPGIVRVPPMNYIAVCGKGNPNDENGECVQCMYIGSYDDEPQTIAAMHEYARQQGYELDISDTRFHHEIYLSDPRKSEVSKLKTVVRHPIKK